MASKQPTVRVQEVARKLYEDLWEETMDSPIPYEEQLAIITILNTLVGLDHQHYLQEEADAAVKQRG